MICSKYFTRKFMLTLLCIGNHAVESIVFDVKEYYPNSFIHWYKSNVFEM